ncbi:MAG: hypothetical protein ACRCUE_18510 [Bosea sp. (in: a-proteobacteria)]
MDVLTDVKHPMKCRLSHVLGRSHTISLIPPGLAGCALNPCLKMDRYRITAGHHMPGLVTRILHAVGSQYHTGDMLGTDSAGKCRKCATGNISALHVQQLMSEQPQALGKIS